MRVYLMRHAAAAEPATGSDAVRPLTEEGRRQAREAGEALQARKPALAAILTSPRLRARETADLVAAQLEGDVPVEIRERLDCGATAAAYLDALRSVDGQEVLVVAHNPEITAIASGLTGQPLLFRPSTLCCIDLTGDSATLDWIRQPA